MVSLFLREQKRYTFEQLCGLLNCSEGKAVHILKRLREFGIVKMVRTVESQRNMKELFEENMIVCDIDHGSRFDIDLFCINLVLNLFAGL